MSIFIQRGKHSHSKQPSIKLSIDSGNAGKLCYSLRDIPAQYGGVSELLLLFLLAKRVIFCAFYGLDDFGRECSR